MHWLQRQPAAEKRIRVRRTGAVAWIVEWKSGRAKREQIDNRGKKEALSVHVTTKDVVQGTTTQLVQDIEAELNQRECRRQAVSWYAQLRNFFPTDDMPHFHDHDFPIPDILIGPDCYLLLQSPDNPAVSKDKLGREVVEVQATGQMWIYNLYSSLVYVLCFMYFYFYSISNCAWNKIILCYLNEHLNQLCTSMMSASCWLVILRWKSLQVLCAITDSGPDWTPKSNVNKFFMARLWRDEQLWSGLAQRSWFIEYVLGWRSVWWLQRDISASIQWRWLNVLGLPGC